MSEYECNCCGKLRHCSELEEHGDRLICFYCVENTIEKLLEEQKQ